MSAEIKQAELALAARERLLKRAAEKAAYHERLLQKQITRLHELKCKFREPTSDDFRLRVVRDDCRGWGSDQDMLEEVFGDAWCVDTMCDKCDGTHTPHDDAQEYIDAWHGDGIYSWGARLEQRNRVTGEWDEIDSCYGFHSINDVAPEDQMRDQLTYGPSKGCEVIYGDDE